MALLTVTDLTHLNALQIHEENEMAYVESEKQYYRWHEGAWEHIEIQGSGIEVNLHDLNKSVMAQMTPVIVREYKDFFEEYAKSQNAHYYILFSFYTHYYTLFAQDPHETLSFGEVMCEILNDFEGYVYSISKSEDKPYIEFWISMSQEAEPEHFILAPYDEGVVTFG